RVLFRSQQATPLAVSGRENTAFAAPRNLKAPVGCMFSSLSSTSQPGHAADGINGVRTTVEAILRRAAITSASSSVTCLLLVSIWLYMRHRHGARGQEDPGFRTR